MINSYEQCMLMREKIGNTFLKLYIYIIVIKKLTKYEK